MLLEQKRGYNEQTFMCGVICKCCNNVVYDNAWGRGRLFIEPHSLWIEGVRQSGGPGPYGPVPSSGGKKLEQVTCQVVLITQDFVHWPKQRMV